MSPESPESGRARRSHQIFTTSLWKLLPLELLTFSLKFSAFHSGFLLKSLRELHEQQNLAWDFVSEFPVSCDKL